MRPQHDRAGGWKVDPTRQACGLASEGYQRNGTEAPENAKSQVGALTHEGRTCPGGHHFGRT
eukprot:2882434-Heterocapsa_arctica.AAC.1